MSKRAPVQGWAAGIPWELHLEAYSAYCKLYGNQSALIDLEGRNCRGGFHADELDVFIPGWRERASAFGALELELIEMRQQRDKAEYDRTYAIGAIKSLLRELGEQVPQSETK